MGFFDNGGFIGRTADFGSVDRFKTTRIEYVAHEAAAHANSVLVPLLAEEGDLAVISDCVDTGSVSNPTGWTLIRADSASSNVGGASYYKILTAADIGSTVLSTNGVTTGHWMLCAIFRRDNTDSTITVNDVYGVATTDNPAAQTISCAGDVPPILACTVWMQRASNNSWATADSLPSPTEDGELVVYNSALGVLRLFYHIFDVGDTPVDITSNMKDSGAQVAQKWYFKFVPAGAFKTSGVWSMQAVYNSKY